MRNKAQERDVSILRAHQPSLKIPVTVRAKSEKPKTVTYAEWALWTWTAWVCLFGLYQTGGQIPEFEQALTDDLQGAITIAPQSLLAMAAAGYAALAAISAWIVLKIGAGKHWARSSLMWGFVFQVICMVLPPYHKMGAAEYRAIIPDLGLQIYALYLLYAPPGSVWFQPQTPADKKN